MVFRRCSAAVVMVAALAACGGDDDAPVIADSETTSSTAAPGSSTSEAPDPGGNGAVVPADLEFRPVVELLPPGGLPEDMGGSDDGCTTPDEAWAADRLVLAPQLENGEEAACLRLGPSDVGGDVVESAAAVEMHPGPWMISLVLTGEGIVGFNELAGACFAGAETCPTRQLAIVVDRTVISAPSINAPEFDRDAIAISGRFTQAEAEALAARLG